MCMLICGNNFNHISTFHILYCREKDVDARKLSTCMKTALQVCDI